MEKGEIVYASNHYEDCSDRNKVIFIEDKGTYFICAPLEQFVRVKVGLNYDSIRYEYVRPVISYDELFDIGTKHQREQLELHEEDKWGWDDMNVDRELIPSLRLQIQKLLNPDNKDERVKIATHIANYAHMIIYNLTKENL